MEKHTGFSTWTQLFARKALALALAAGCSAAAVAAGPGSLDPTFGNNGSVMTGLDENHTGGGYNGLVAQADGKIVGCGVGTAAGHTGFVLTRYLGNGNVDTTFGTGGFVRTSIGAGPDICSQLKTYRDGRYIAAGQTTVNGIKQIAVVRYLPDGHLDFSFGINGKVVLQLGTKDSLAANIAIQNDGKIVIATDGLAGGNGYDFALARLNVDGSLDHSFGLGGMTLIPIYAGTAGNDSAYDVLVQPDGKIVACGLATPPTGNKEVALVRLNGNGALDPSFGNGGKATIAFTGGPGFCTSVALQWDGKLVTAGMGWNGTNNDFTLVRFTADGKPDTTFGVGGKVRTAIGGGEDAAHTMVVQPDGAIVAAGKSYNGYIGNYDMAFARYLPDGKLDTTFAGRGYVRYNIGTIDYANALALQPDGKLVAVGHCGTAACAVRLESGLFYTQAE